MTAALTVRAAAERLGVHPDTVRRAIARGEFTAVRVGRALRVPAVEVEARLQGANA